MTTSPTAATTAASTLAAATGGTSAAGVSADYNMFLKLLTTQMQNQDPLNPTDSTQYTQQLAQYSQVEQTIQQTETLKSILARFTTQDMAQASGFIGREAQFNSATSGLAGSTPASWTYTADRSIASLVATVSDSNGKVVDTRTVSASGTTGRFSWDGQRTNGSRAGDGAYSVAMAATDAAGNTVPLTVASVGFVQDVTSNNGTINLGVNGVMQPESSMIRLSSVAGTGAN